MALEYFYQVLISVLFISTSFGAKWHEEKYSHRSQQLDQDGFREFAFPKTKMDFESLLDPILIPRVSGTEGNRQVASFIKTEMKNLGWTVETDPFQSNTPEGLVNFENIIATLDPNAARRLVIACHYDSKLFKNEHFVGATDSAVPCAMMLHLAHTLRGPLERHRGSAQHNLTLQFIFFDGEEAFKDWSSTDSLYGARNLAAKWEKQKFPPNTRANTNNLHRMDMLVLLDLIGTKNPSFANFFESTSNWHGHLGRIENYLRNNRMWTGNHREKGYFANTSPNFGGIEDDHIPFLQRNVDILHLIATPFPSVWHTPRDNKDALDFPTIENLNRILRVFVATYLHLQGDRKN